MVWFSGPHIIISWLLHPGVQTSQPETPPGHLTDATHPEKGCYLWCIPCWVGLSLHDTDQQISLSPIRRSDIAHWVRAACHSSPRYYHQFHFLQSHDADCAYVWFVCLPWVIWSRWNTGTGRYVRPTVVVNDRRNDSKVMMMRVASLKIFEIVLSSLLLLLSHRKKIFWFDHLSPWTRE